MPDVVILYTTWPDAEKAEAVGVEAVCERLAACANVYPPIRSTYRWQGALEHASETPMILKTTLESATALRDFLVARHPYDAPCVLTLPVDAALSHDGFVAWLCGAVAPVRESASRGDPGPG